MRISPKSLLLSLLITGGMYAFAANPEKHIMSHSAGDDMILFVKPRKMPSAVKQASSAPIVYDITLSTQTDSVSITYTLTSNSPAIQADSTFINGSKGFANERIYVEPKSKKWISRLRFKMPADAFRETFGKPEELQLRTGDLIFLLPSKKQAKEAEINLTALQIIELNKK